MLLLFSAIWTMEATFKRLWASFSLFPPLLRLLMHRRLRAKPVCLLESIFNGTLEALRSPLQANRIAIWLSFFKIRHRFIQNDARHLVCNEDGLWMLFRGRQKPKIRLNLVRSFCRIIVRLVHVCGALKNGYWWSSSPFFWRQTSGQVRATIRSIERLVCRRRVLVGSFVLLWKKLKWLSRFISGTNCSKSS